MPTKETKVLKMLRKRIDEPTAAEIANSVRKGTELQMAESLMRQLREKRDAAMAELRDLIAANEAGRHDKRITSVCQMERDLSAQVDRAQATVNELRAKRAVDVEAALADRRRSAATAILETLEALRGQLAEIEDVQGAIAAAGGPLVHVPSMRAVTQIERIALRYRGS